MKRVTAASIKADEARKDNRAVDAFAKAMKRKLAQKRREGYSGWETADVRRLCLMLVQHVDKGDPVDVANFAMMIHQRLAAMPKDAEQAPLTHVARVERERRRRECLAEFFSKLQTVVERTP